MTQSAFLSIICRASLILLLLAGLRPPDAVAGEARVYTIGVIPNMPAVTMHKNWTPLAERLSRELGARFEIKVYDKIGTFLEESNAGVPDFIYSAPNMFFLSYQKQKYQPLVRSSVMLNGRVFVRKDSPYKSIKDLKGKTIAFVGPKNVCSVITRHALLTGAGAIDYNTAYSGSTINVAKSVLLGKADAGATLDVSMMNDLPDMLHEFRILLETEKIASHPLAGHPRVPRVIRDGVTKAVLAMDKTPDGRKLLETVKLKSPMLADYNRDYKHFAEVDFDRLDRQQ